MGRWAGGWEEDYGDLDILRSLVRIRLEGDTVEVFAPLLSLHQKSIEVLAEGLLHPPPSYGALAWRAPAGPTPALWGFIAGSRGPLGKCILAGADLRVS